MLALIEQFLNQQVLGELQSWRPTSGTPQGAVISPLLSNIYLNPLDHLLASEGFEMVRYADDFVIMCRTESEAKRALERVQSWVTENGLQLHPTKTQIADTEGKGFDFLGYHFEREHRWPRKRSVKKLRAVLREKTRRTDGRSLSVIISDVNQTLRGWFEYFKHSNKRVFGILDSWIRMRLRSILRKRAGRRGRGRGLDHHRYRNKFFEAKGLYSLLKSHRLAVQSSKR